MLLLHVDGGPPVRRPPLRRRSRIPMILHFQLPHRARYTRPKDSNPAKEHSVGANGESASILE